MKRWVFLPAVALVTYAACTDETRTPLAPEPETEVPTLEPTGPRHSGHSGPTGAIFTTVPDGSVVNENVRYNDKREVYLDGGPRGGSPQHAAGLDDGFYVFQITDPSGRYLLSMDPARCRVMEVRNGIIIKLWKPSELKAAGGPLAGASDFSGTDTYSKPGTSGATQCQVPDAPHPLNAATRADFGRTGQHDTNTDVDYGTNGAIVVQMMPYGTTPNPGGVYKAWVSKLDAYLSKAAGKTGGSHPLDVQPRAVRGKDAQPCPDFCADADPGFGPPRNLQKTDNFKVKEEARLRVIKINDLDGDGTLDAGEPEINGWRVALIETLFDATTTRKDDVTPATWTVTPNTTVKVCEEVRSGWAFKFALVNGTATTATLEGGEYCVTVSIGSGSSTVTVAFGNFDLGDKSGLKFHDLNGNGARNDGEGVLASWTIKLLNAGGTEVGSTTTNASGEYRFDNLDAGTYTVCEVLTGEWRQSAPNASTTLPAGESLVDCPTGRGYGAKGIRFTINASGQSLTGNNFGNFLPASISGVKYEDLDGDAAARETGEPGAPTFEIHLFGTDNLGNAVHLHSITDTNGAYGFTGLNPGTYRLCETQQAAWTQSYPKAGVANAINCSTLDPAHGAGGGTPTGAGAASGYGYQVALASGASVTANFDFGNFRPGDIGGRKLSDVNGSQTIDAGDSPLSGWEIHLFGTDGRGNAVHLHALTNSSGVYRFDDVAPGTYRLCETQRTNWVQRYPTLATTGAIDCTALNHTSGGGTPTGVGAAGGIGYQLALTSNQDRSADFDFLNQPTQGCTPGFWKQEHHYGYWTYSPYSPFTSLLRTAFSAFNGQGGYSSNLTMRQALDLDNSTGIGQVLRHGVAALLNSYRANHDLAFAYTPAQVQAKVNSALTDASLAASVHAELAAANERGCPNSPQWFWPTQ